ncbi:XK-related protein 9 [Gouania willdenowi]|uniref:XK-related protein n=1 Tax=Gouania willdenowi TaxID=441366 RepID=A0A8C5HR43_GOUWI|nr:XK-related protein 9 [Gouania willdenowi]
MLDSQYSKPRWLLTIAGLLLFVCDIWTDIGLALTYFLEEQYVWCGLTLLFVVTGVLVTQIFSCSWYWDDINDVLMMKPDEKTKQSGMSKRELAVLHACGLGVFTRYFHLLHRGFEVLWIRRNCCTAEEIRNEHNKLFCAAADLSMLKLFKAFLESVPQLLLQLYIQLCHGEGSYMQYISLAFSFLSVAWGLVDYRRCLRRSLPHLREMPSGIPTFIYLIYKLCTITSLILSYSLLLLLSTYTTVGFIVLWLIGTIWAHLLQTNFCSSKSLELLYRAVIGVILVFTFFNVKGQDTKAAMLLYYSLHFIINLTALLLLALLKPELQMTTLFLTLSTLIIGGLVLGLVCLLLYYFLLHPRGKNRVADEVDGLGKQTETRRITNFMQP